MILRIEDREYLPDDIDPFVTQGVKLINVATFNDKRMHPWLASNTWDEIVLKLDPKLNYGYIKQLLMRISVIKLIIPMKLNFDATVLNILTAVYPNSAAALRNYFVKKDFESINKVLVEEGAIFE